MEAFTFTRDRLAAMTPDECAKIAAAFFVFGASKLEAEPAHPPAYATTKRPSHPPVPSRQASQKKQNKRGKR